MLRFEEALARIMALGAPPLPSLACVLDECDGRVLGDDLLAGADLPGFDYSAMDGYAVRASDLDAAPPFRLPVRGESRTGAVPGAHAPRTAMRIFTGAALPRGADTVVMQENVAREGDVAVITARPRTGQHVRRRGEHGGVDALRHAQGDRPGDELRCLPRLEDGRQDRRMDAR